MNDPSEQTRPVVEVALNLDDWCRARGAEAVAALQAAATRRGHPFDSELLSIIEQAAHTGSAMTIQKLSDENTLTPEQVAALFGEIK